MKAAQLDRLDPEERKRSIQLWRANQLVALESQSGGGGPLLINLEDEAFRQSGSPTDSVVSWSQQRPRSWTKHYLCWSERHISWQYSDGLLLSAQDWHKPRCLRDWLTLLSQLHDALGKSSWSINANVLCYMRRLFAVAWNWQGHTTFMYGFQESIYLKGSLHWETQNTCLEWLYDCLAAFLNTLSDWLDFCAFLNTNFCQNSFNYRTLFV